MRRRTVIAHPRADAARATAARACCWPGRLALPVVLGRSGIRANKREGDGATPRGPFPAAAAVVAGRPRCRGRATLLPVRRIDADRRLVRGSQPTAATTGRSGGRPMNQATGSGATTISTTSSSRSTTTPARGWPGAAARCSCMWRGRTGRRPPAAWRSRPTTCDGCSATLGPKTRIIDSLVTCSAGRSVASPKIAVPTRTWVAPNAIAIVKVGAHPHRQQLQARCGAAILAVSAKCGAGGSSAGGMHIRPAIASP